MIKQVPETNQTIIQFGTGDINILPGIMKEEDIGMIALRNQSPRKIGIYNGEKAETIKKMSDVPVILQFNKIESIDVLIFGLNQTKEMMLHREEWLNKDNTLID